MNSTRPSLPRRFAAAVFRGEERQIDLLVIHCAASPNGHSLFRHELGDPGFMRPIDVVDEWHRARSFKRAASWRARFNPSLTSVGYHFLIYTNGAIETGRHRNEVGAHAEGWNSQSLGICMVGTNAFTQLQWDALRELLVSLEKPFIAAGKPLWIRGHRDLPDVHKECPGFSVDDWLANGRQALPGAICKEIN